MASIFLRCREIGVVVEFFDGKKVAEKSEPTTTQAGLARALKAIIKRRGKWPVMTTSSVVWAEQYTTDRATLRLCEKLRS